MADTKTPKIKVLIFIDYFIPGFKAGGILRAVYNLVKNITDIEFYIVTRNKDLGEKEAYQGLKQNQWLHTNLDHVMYLSPKNETIKDFSRIIKEVHPDYLYLQCLYSLKYSIIPNLVARFFFPEIRILIAANGMLSKEAIHLKHTKKKLFFALIKWLGIYRKATWHATTIAEKEDIQSVFGVNSNIKIAPYIVDFNAVTYSPHSKKKNELNLFFFSRISEKKNLLGAIELLQSVSCNVVYSIIGPIEEAWYFNQCTEAIKQLPANIHIQFVGEIPFLEVLERLKNYHFLFLPTLHENFGHVIIESMLAGCPVIISNRTPFLQLQEQHIGWDLPLEEPLRWINAFSYCNEMDQLEYDQMSRAAFNYAIKSLDNPSILALNRQLFT